MKIIYAKKIIEKQDFVFYGFKVSCILFIVLFCCIPDIKYIKIYNNTYPRYADSIYFENPLQLFFPIITKQTTGRIIKLLSN